MQERRVRSIGEARDLRALAHPLRLRLLGALRLDGPATASDLARRFAVSSGLTSYHLRMLAAHDFVEDDPGRTGGRERWWRATHDAHQWDVPADGDPIDSAGHVDATRALNVEVARIFAEHLEAWAEIGPGQEGPWRTAIGMSDRWLTLSPGRARELVDEVDAVVERYAGQPDEGDDARRVGFLFALGPDRTAP